MKTSKAQMAHYVRRQAFVVGFNAFEAARYLRLHRANPATRCWKTMSDEHRLEAQLRGRELLMWFASDRAEIIEHCRIGVMRARECNGAWSRARARLVDDSNGAIRNQIA